MNTKYYLEFNKYINSYAFNVIAEVYALENLTIEHSFVIDSDNARVILYKGDVIEKVLSSQIKIDFGMEYSHFAIIVRASNALFSLSFECIEDLKD